MPIGGGYAVCSKHVEDAVAWAVDRKLPLRVRAVSGDGRFQCHCRNGADYFLYEVEAVKQ